MISNYLKIYQQDLKISQAKSTLKGKHVLVPAHFISFYLKIYQTLNIYRNINFKIYAPNQIISNFLKSSQIISEEATPCDRLGKSENHRDTQ